MLPLRRHAYCHLRTGDFRQDGINKQPPFHKLSGAGKHHRMYFPASRWQISATRYHAVRSHHRIFLSDIRGSPQYQKESETVFHSLCKFLKRLCIAFTDPSHGFADFCRMNSIFYRCENQSVTICHNFKSSFSSCSEQIQNRTLNDQRRTVSVFCQCFNHRNLLAVTTLSLLKYTIK